HGLNNAVHYHRGSQTCAQSEKEQLPAFIASERLHRSIVHDPDGATECLSEIESDPAATQVMRFCNRMTVQDRSRITDRDHVERPSPRQFANICNHLLGRHRRSGWDFPWLMLGAGQNLDVRAADIDDEDLHGAVLA